MAQMERLKRLEQRILAIDKRIHFLAVNPTNVASEKRKFFAKKDYNPQFRYKKLGFQPNRLKASLEKIKCKHTVMDQLLKEKIAKDKLMVEFLQHRGTELFPEASEALYGVPDEKLLKAAQRFVRRKIKKPKTEKKISAKKVKTLFQIALLKYGFEWKIKEKDMPAKAAVYPSKQTIYLKKNQMFSKTLIRRLIVHEIGTHVLRAENGMRQPYQLFFNGLPNYVLTEEGLAAFNEEINGIDINKTLKTYAGRVLAINKASTASFRETYDYLRKWFSKEDAWTLTLRAKRGLGDTTIPGACTKDLAYLRGYLAVKEYVKKGGKLDKLYYGRIGIEHVALLPKIEGLIHPNLLPFMQYFDFFINLITLKLMIELPKFLLRPVIVPFLTPYKEIKDLLKL